MQLEIQRLTQTNEQHVESGNSFVIMGYLPLYILTIATEFFDLLFCLFPVTSFCLLFLFESCINASCTLKHLKICTFIYMFYQMWKSKCILLCFLLAALWTSDLERVTKNMFEILDWSGGESRLHKISTMMNLIPTLHQILLR